MDYPTALEQLLRHAGLAKSKPTAADFQYTLYLISDKKKFVPIQPLADDILACLEAVNQHLNGAQPAGTDDADKAQMLDRPLVYAVNSLLTTGKKYAAWMAAESGFEAAQVEEMRRAVQSIELGWNFVLAGDSNSIRKEVATWLD
ncbi:hypothetical protein F0P96_13445 [Hymenobacter busanensis]|uniref:Uncharacterized protein n=1 Tax=Hymenobacter busanensis TaxID=2607656 RepID=A0A7L4ZY84_9BACT|nr:hypothetical protein [Hymenobacter busanensis]KAA9332470.1 hypothetical protein F0P96_13445 [Hymenobacter busanensis]QHJ07192.1 hypothetical protein GUY19_07825 [Hymenobacter busanensis]